MNRGPLIVSVVVLMMSLAPPALSAEGADLSVSVTDSKDPAKKDKKLTYTIKIVNAGPDTADSVALIFDLPGSPCYEFPDPSCQPTVDFLWARPSAGVCGGEAEGYVSCELGNLKPGAQFIVKVRLIPLVCGEIRGGAFVGANNESDPYPSPNNQDFESTTVVCR